MTAPTQLSDEDAKKDYLALCLKMTHAQLYAELMRVHKEATLLIQQAVEQEREACAQLCEELDDASYPSVRIFPAECAKQIRARSQ